MERNDQTVQSRSFLGTGWAFPPSFEGGAVSMVSDEEDIKQSLEILFRTVPKERLMRPDFGLDMRMMLFEPVSTTVRTMLTDQITTGVLIHEPRIRVVSVSIQSPDAADGALTIHLEYEVRATNSRFNLVFPFYRSDSNEARAAVRGTADEDRV